MRRTIAALLIAALSALLAGLGAIAPAGAAGPLWTYYATSGGTQANLLGKVVTTDLTAASNIGGPNIPNEGSNALAKVKVPGLIKVGAIKTKQVAEPYEGDGVQVTSTAEIAGINLLKGAIKVSAVKTTNIARASSAGFSKDAHSELVKLKIGGKKYPLSASPNTKIEIPGLAEVVINEQISNQGPSGIETKTNALRVTLLKDFAGAKLGSTIRLAPSNINILSGSESDAIAVGGFAYGTAIMVGAADIRASVPPTAFLQIPSAGTGGQDYTNSTAAVDLDKVLQLGVIESKVRGTSDVGYADSFAQSEIARVNVLNGLITADAIKVQSHVEKTANGHTEEQSLDFVNLKVAGKEIPINVAPNTAIHLFGIGVVYINQQLSQSGYSAIVGVRLIVSGKNLGLPVGADVQLGVASTFTAAS